MASYLDKLTDQELVDMILDWAAKKKAPPEFRPRWTINMHGLLQQGRRLTPRQRLGLYNVIVGWNVDGRHPSRRNPNRKEEEPVRGDRYGLSDT